MEIGSLKSTNLNGGFLHDKYLLNLKITTDAVYNQFKKTGRIDAFNFGWKDGDEKKPHFFWDSDVFKWMEGVCYLLQKAPNPDLENKLNWLFDKIIENQEKNGYFNIYFTVCEKDKRFTDRDAHELYCAGHLFEAVCAYWDYRKDEKILNIAKKYADHIYDVFVVEKSAEFQTPGHEEIELALFRLYKITKDKKHLDLCRFFIDKRGKENRDFCQSHLPVRKQKEAVGHCVRALYLYSAMADLAKELKDDELLDSVKSLFFDIVSKKMHITGGIGQKHAGEAFSLPYDLKNETSYTETCASIAMILFCERLFLIDHSSIYTDIIERELYNGMISGLSLDGKGFFYTNPLEIKLESKKSGNADWLPISQRVPSFTCSCCPPNITRTLASIQRLLFSREDKDIYINQFADSQYNSDGISIKVETDFPNSGKIKVKSVGAEKIYIRIPHWCDSFSVSCNYKMVNGYAEICQNDFEIELDMNVKFIMSNENVSENANKVSLMRGPIVYCAEGIDNADTLHKLYIDTSSTPKVENDEFLKLPTLTASSFLRKTPTSLYSILKEDFEETKIKLIPYSTFANRGETDMKVWLNYR